MYRTCSCLIYHISVNFSKCSTVLLAYPAGKVKVVGGVKRIRYHVGDLPAADAEFEDLQGGFGAGTHLGMLRRLGPNSIEQFWLENSLEFMTANRLKKWNLNPFYKTKLKPIFFY